MRQFPLAVEGEVRSFDTDGRVLDTADNVVGSWTTTEDNRIRVVKAEGDSVDLAVDWSFNASNHLTISIGGRELFAIVNTVDGLPRYRLDKNILVVDPDGDGDFEFRLHCLFGMNGQGNLVLSINGVESVIDGFIEDKKSRFRFQFFDKQLPNFPNSLVLSGQWERKPVANEIRLHFKLDDPTLEIAGKSLDLPAAVRVDPARNHLALIYQSTSHGERRLQFLGSFDIRPGFTLVFRIDDVKDGGVRKSKIEVETTFEFDAAQGSLSLFVGKVKTPTSQVVEVGGALRVVLKNNATLDWTFAYQKNTAGGKAVTTIATALQFKFEQNQLLVEFKQEGKVRSVNVTAKVVKEDFTLTGGVQIVNDPQGRRIKSFIGISF